MKSSLLLLLSCIAMSFVHAQPRAGTPSPLDAASISTKPYVRWWWFADEIKPSDTRAQLQWLRDNGFGGVEVAWVYPLSGDSTRKRPEWLSKQWSKAVAEAAKQCDELGLGFDMTFGTLWPFGDSKVPVADGAMTYGSKESPASMRLTWEHPKRGRVLNHLDSEALGRYSKRLFKAMEPALKGKNRGLFCDSWEVETRKLWTSGFAERFRDTYGYDIEPLMDSLYLPGYGDVHYDYMSLLSSFVVDEFYGPFTSLAHSRGAYTRVQCAGAPADLIEAYRRVDIPETEAMLFEPDFARIAASAAALDGKPLVSAEAFTCLYGWKGWPGPGPHQGDEKIADLKLVADALFANGVNHFIWHGMPYNPPGRDEKFYASVHVSPKAPLAQHILPFNDYISEISRAMRRGKTYADMAVYLPTEDAWTRVELPDSLQFPWAWGHYEMRYIKVPEELKRRHALWINGRALREARVVSNRLHTGQAVFNSLLVNVQYMDVATLEALVRVVEQGVPVVLLQVPVEAGRTRSPQWSKLLGRLLTNEGLLRSPMGLPSAPLVDGATVPDFWCREDGEELYLFLANPASKGLRYPLRHKQATEMKHERMDVTLRWRGFQVSTTLDFLPGKSVLLLLRPDGYADEIPLPFFDPALD
ncbi:MAG: glycosyl hydrolase [Bacteroidia bacterium]|nr:glycosyl hydrolase [Bacteroidia bacterium]